MKKDFDWNQAIIGNEDWNAACNSEIFRNFVGITLAKERQENKLKKMAEQENDETEEYMKSFPNPLRSNLDYGKYNNPENVDFGTDRESLSEAHSMTGDGVSDDAGPMGGFGNSSVEDNFDAINKSIEADAERLYDENIKLAQLSKAEEALGLDTNMYYQILKAEEGDK